MGPVRMGLVMGLLQLAVIVEPRIVSRRTLSVRPTVDLHLQQPQVKPQLDLFAVVPFDDAHRDPFRIKVPPIQDVGNIAWHGAVKAQ